jgi:hypothetical protein
MTSEEPVHRNFWKKEEENLLKQWADKAQCYQWMHAKSHDIYSRKNALFTIPVIIISTITGTANFAQDRFSDDIKTYVVISIGTLSIIAGIITTVYQFLKIAELNEGHRVSSLSWGKFYRNIKTELTRHPLDRTPPLEMIKISRDEYDRLVELSPFMPVKVIRDFNSKFNKSKHTELTKPEICDELMSTMVFELRDEERNALIHRGSKKLDVDPKETRRKQLIRQKLDTKVERFKQTFHSLNGRDPTKDEIAKNMARFVEAIPTDDDTASQAIECNEIVIQGGAPSPVYNQLFEAGGSGSSLSTRQTAAANTVVLEIDNTITEEVVDDEDFQEPNEDDGNDDGGDGNKKIV